MFTVPASWKNTSSGYTSIQEGHHTPSSSRHPTQTYLIKGAKNAGKSSFARVLVNDLLLHHGRVAFLECDPGQTEFTPPGMLSLHVVDKSVDGRPFTHLRQPFRSHFLGSTTPRNNPSHYISCIEALVATYLEAFRQPEYDAWHSESDASQEVPLVVNTMGWTKGFGGDLLKRIEEIVRPTHIVSVGEASSNENPQPDAVVDSPPSNDRGSGYGIEPFEPTRISVEGIPFQAESSRYTAADWRSLSLMAYFHSSHHPSPFSDVESLLQWNASSPLLSIKPYAVSVRTALDNIVLSGSSSDDVVPTELGRVLNGAVVAFVSCDPGTVDIPHLSSSENLPYRQGAPLPDPRTSHCVGLGLIRGVSPDFLSPELRRDGQQSSEILHIITPVPLSVLRDENCRCIVKGEIELPVWGMTDSRDGQGDIPYLQSRRPAAAGSDRRRIRRNIMRKSQF